MPKDTKVTKYFVRTLKRNAAKFLLHPPKFFNARERFHYSYEFSNGLRPVIRAYFLCNETCGVRSSSGKRGLACILYDVYSYEPNSIDNSQDYPMDTELFDKRVKTTFLEDDSISSVDFSGYGLYIINMLPCIKNYAKVYDCYFCLVKIFVWSRGSIVMESLQTKITTILTYTLWDIYLEQFFYEEAIVIEKPEAYVNPLCIQFLTKWIAFGARQGIPFARHSQIQCRYVFK